MKNLLILFLLISNILASQNKVVDSIFSTSLDENLFEFWVLNSIRENIEL